MSIENHGSGSVTITGCAVGPGARIVDGRAEVPEAGAGSDEDVIVNSGGGTVSITNTAVPGRLIVNEHHGEQEPAKSWWDMDEQEMRDDLGEPKSWWDMSEQELRDDLGR